MDCVCSMFIRHIHTSTVETHWDNSLLNTNQILRIIWFVAVSVQLRSKQILMKRLITRNDFLDPLFLFNNFPLYVRMHIRTHTYVQVYHITVLVQF